MNHISHLYRRLIDAMGVEGLEIPAACVKLYRHEDQIPECLEQYYPSEETLTSCQAVRHTLSGI